MRLIDADELRKPIYAEEDNITGSGMTYAEMDGYNDGIDAAWSRIDNAPTIDAKPVRRGHWEHDSTGANYCSACGEYPYDDGEWHMVWHCDYCPNCGAKMDEVKINKTN